MEAWLARVRRLPAPAEGAILERRFVNRLIVDVYLKRIDLVAKAGGSFTFRTNTRPTLCSHVPSPRVCMKYGMAFTPKVGHAGTSDLGPSHCRE
jgi:hypothetical protein